MIKCGTIAALVIAGTAAGTTSLLSDSSRTKLVSAEGQPMAAQEVTQRGTRSPLIMVDGFTPAVGTQPRRGERAEYQAVAVAMSTSATDGIRRGTR